MPAEPCTHVAPHNIMDRVRTAQARLHASAHDEPTRAPMHQNPNEHVQSPNSQPSAQIRGLRNAKEATEPKQADTLQAS